MNDFALYMGKVVYEYQISKGGKGDAEPKEIIEGLVQVLGEFRFWYGMKGELAKPCEHCNSGSYYCECRK